MSTHASRAEALALPALAAGAWLLTAQRMAGMDDLGSAGRFAVSWLLMMAAMMLPSLVPAALAVAQSVPAFVAGYLAVWTAAGLAAYVVGDRMSRPMAVAVILVAAAYQLTAIKGHCLERCRHPASGGLRGGLHHGASCARALRRGRHAGAAGDRGGVTSSRGDAANNRSRRPIVRMVPSAMTTSPARMTVSAAGCGWN
jgi:predicted metal-binding membrane protein